MAARDKERFYWLKLHRNFFKRHDMMILEEMPDGKEQVLLYLKLMTEAIDHEGKLRFSETIPYTAEMLATVTRSDAGMVQKTLDTLQAFGLMSKEEDGTLWFPEVAKLLDSETYGASRKRSYRSEENSGDIVPRSVAFCPQDTDTDKDTDTEKETEKETETEVYTVPEGTVSRTKDVRRVMEAWNSLGLQQLTKITPGSNRGKMLRARIHSYGAEAVLEAIEKIRQSAFLKGQNSKGWVITFEWFVRPNNFPKVLEGNYDNGRAKDTVETANPFLKMLLEDGE